MPEIFAANKNQPERLALAEEAPVTYVHEGVAFVHEGVGVVFADVIFVRAVAPVHGAHVRED